MELIVIMLLTLILLPVVELTTGPLRIILGAIFLIFFPGYALMAALFPREDSLQRVERVALSFVLSIAVVPLILLILNYTPWGIRLEPIFAAVASFIFVASLAAYFRRRRLPREERFELRIRIEMPRWGSRSGLDKAIAVVLAISIAGAVGALFYVVTAPKAEDAFTDFYLLGSEALMENYPGELVLGEEVGVTLGITNHERQQTDYDIEVVLEGEKVLEIGPVSLPDGEEWRERVTLVPTRAGEDQKVEFLLYKGEEAEPYSTLRLWLDVKREG
ncbi:MAG: DUF1616 domain-containing protein [Dehalococcoidia bacterium]